MPRGNGSQGATWRTPLRRELRPGIAATSEQWSGTPAGSRRRRRDPWPRECRHGPDRPQSTSCTEPPHTVEGGFSKSWLSPLTVSWTRMR